MNSELIVDVRPSEISIALLEDKRLVEPIRKDAKNNLLLGISTWAGWKIMPGLNAAFVDVGYEKTLFYTILI